MQTPEGHLRQQSMTILCLIGTRPEAIKMAPVVRSLKSHAGVNVIVCVTGQHREMLDPILKFFEIKPDIDLGLMRPDQTLAGLTARLVEGLDEVIRRCAPDWVVAQGDTTSVMAAAMAAFYRGVPFAHVEAGLRTGDLSAPFPEEFHRRVADMVACLHFAPTEQARQQLIAEGINESQIILTGNTVVDALMEAVRYEPDWNSGPLDGVDPHRPIVLVTAHRRESFGQPMREICEAVSVLARMFQERQIQWVFPVHLNPNVRRTVMESLRNSSSVILLEPLDYPWLVQLMKHSRLILTDSGGIQEEAPSLGVPVLVLRSSTERPEGVQSGQAKLVGWHREDIIRETCLELNLNPAGHHQSQDARSAANPYGDGKAGIRIAEALLGYDR